MRGALRVGDELLLVPGTDRRVRGCAACMRKTARSHEAFAGQRMAVGVAGLAKDEVARGQWLVAPDIASVQRAHRRAAGRLARRGAGAALGHTGARAPGRRRRRWAAWRCSTRRQPGAGRTRPGAAGAARADRRPGMATAWCCAMPRPAARIAGGTVLDPFAPARYRRTPQRLAELQALTLPSLPAACRGPGSGLAAWVSTCSACARPPATVRRRRERAAARCPAHASTAMANGRWARNRSTRRGRRCSPRSPRSTTRIPTTSAPTRRGCAAWPCRACPSRCGARCSMPCTAEGLVTRSGAFVHLPAHGVQLSATEQRIAQKVAPILAAGGCRGRLGARPGARRAGVGATAAHDAGAPGPAR